MKACILFIIFYACIIAQSNHPLNEVLSYYNKGRQNLQKNLPGKASVNLKKAKDLLDKYYGEGKPKSKEQVYNTFAVYSTYGRALIDLNRVEDAIKVREKAFKKVKLFYGNQKNIFVSNVLNNMGYTYSNAVGTNKERARKMAEQAFSCYKQALQMQKDLHLDEEDPGEYMITLNNMGSGFEKYADYCTETDDEARGCYKKAIQFYKDSHTIKKRLLKSRVDISLFRTEINIANLYIKMSQFNPRFLNDADQWINKTLQSLKFYNEHGKGTIINDAYICKTDILFRQKKIGDNLEYPKKLFEYRKNFLKHNSWSVASLYKQRNWQQKLELPLDFLISTLNEPSVGKEHTIEVFKNYIYGKSYINEMLKWEKKLLKELTKTDPEIFRLHEEYKETISEISKITYSSDEEALRVYNEFEQKFFDLEGAISQKLKEQYKDPVLTKKQQIQLQKKLKDDSVFLEWVEFEDWNNNRKKSIGCFVVTQKDIRFVLLPHSRKHIYELVHKIRTDIKQDLIDLKNNWNKAISTKKSTEAALKALQEAENRLVVKLDELKNILWTPINDISPSVYNIIVAPCGDLNLIPWGILPLEKSSKQYAVERYNFSYSSSIRDLLKDSSVGKSSTTNGIFCIGDPVLHSEKKEINKQIAMRNIRNSNTWAKCNYFNDELRQAKESSQELFSKEGKLLCGADATKLNFKKEAPNADLLHIVSHATMMKLNHKEKMMDKFPLLKNRFLNNLLRASILFSKNGGGIDYMTALEISILDLSQVQCAIISCCSTGDIISEDAFGFLGFRWAFQQAGAKRTLSNLWDVLDKESATIMKYFYTEYRTWFSYSFAVNESQRKFIKKYTSYTHPGVWGYIICHGVPDFGKKKKDDVEEEEW